MNIGDGSGSGDESLEGSLESKVSTKCNFTEVKPLGGSTNQNEVFQVTTDDDRVLVRKYQGQNAATDEYLLGQLSARIGLNYPTEEVSLLPHGRWQGLHVRN